jgi:cytoplasmic iron level regulating protein YaaA (DUF328/UPF0246 family)
LLILLPPSETKRPGGVGVSIDKAAIIWAALDEARATVIAALESASATEELAVKALKLGKRSAAEASKNLSLWSAPTMPALERYTGVLYDALSYQELSVKALQRAEQQLFIQSALFGLLPAMEQIPDYRLSADSKLPGINLKSLWTQAHAAVWPRMLGPILDMRSESYVALNPIPKDRESYFVEVLDQAQGRALNHFNKRAKGAFVRSALESGLDSISDIAKIASNVGLEAKVTGDRVKLLVPAGY